MSSRPNSLDPGSPVGPTFLTHCPPVGTTAVRADRVLRPIARHSRTDSQRPLPHALGDADSMREANDSSNPHQSGRPT